MGNHQAESKPVREPWPPPSLALLLLCQPPPSQLTGHLPSVTQRTAECRSSGHACSRLSLGPGRGPQRCLQRRVSWGHPQSKHQPPSCRLELEANSEEQTGASATRQPSVSPKFQSFCHTQPRAPVQGFKGETKPEPGSGHCVPRGAGQPLCHPEAPPWGPGAATVPRHHLNGCTPRPHLCKFLSAICFLP